jgi:regulatory protein
LARRDWSREALRIRLLAAAGDENASAGEVDALLDDFASRGWLSDARYAEAIVRSRQSRNGKTAIARRLKQAGISDEDSASALSAIDNEQEFQAALSLWRRKFGAPPASEKEKARQVRFLVARGYSFGLALRVLKQGSAPVEGVGE